MNKFLLTIIGAALIVFLTTIEAANQNYRKEELPDMPFDLITTITENTYIEAYLY